MGGNISELTGKSSKAYIITTRKDLFPPGLVRLANGLVPFCKDARWEAQFKQGSDEDVS
jgi:hypothetical protein